MSDQLFKKAATLTDVHFGRRGNNPVANQDNLDYIDWFIDEAKIWGAETCIMMGDWHENRSSLHVGTLHASLEGVQRLNDNFKKVWWIPGNHDLLYRNKRDVSSIEFVRHLPNIHIVREPLTVGNVTVLPWLLPDERHLIKDLRSRYIFGHLELNGGFLMNAKVPMPDHEDGLSVDDFRDGAEYVFSGHFHFRQSKGNIVYTGNIFPFDFADAGDDDRGMMLLEWGKDPIFRAWPNQPRFRVMKLSDLLNNADRLLKEKMTVRCLLDIEISYEEFQMLKELYLASHGLRKLELVNPPRQAVAHNFNPNATFQTVDQVVIEGLKSIDSNDFNNQTLISIFNELPDF